MEFPSYRGTLQSSKNLQGVYRARVENINDPYSIGRVQVRVPMLHGSTLNSNNFIPSEDLPWASPCFMGAGAGFGSFIVPEVGEYVFVAFEGGDIKKPVYIGSSYGTGAKNDKTFGTDPTKKGNGTWVGKAGNNEVPADARNGACANSKKIIYRSMRGSTFEISDAKGSESISMTDPLGQGLVVSSNLSEKAHKSTYRKSNKNNPSGKEAVKTLSTGANISLKGVLNQGLDIISENNGNSSVNLTNLGANILTKTLDNGDKDIKLITDGSTIEIQSGSNGKLINLIVDGVSMHMRSDGKTITLNTNNATIAMSGSSNNVKVSSGGCYVDVTSSNVVIKGKRQKLVL